MKIRMKVAVSGSRDGKKWPPIGGVIELPDQEAAQYCASGLADPVAEDKVERTVAPQDEERREEAQNESELTTETAESTVPKRGPGRPRKNPA